MKTVILLSFISLSMLLTSSRCSETAQGQGTEQGITGKVLWKEGNMMPGPGQPAQEATPVVREILIYELTHTSKATYAEGSPLYGKVDSQLIKKAERDQKCNFKVQLPPGRYSLFTQEEEGLFANQFDGQGNIQVVEVKAGTYTELTVDIDYKAAY